MSPRARKRRILITDDLDAPFEDESLSPHGNISHSAPATMTQLPTFSTSDSWMRNSRLIYVQHDVQRPDRSPRRLSPRRHDNSPRAAAATAFSLPGVLTAPASFAPSSSRTSSKAVQSLPALSRGFAAGGYSYETIRGDGPMPQDLAGDGYSARSMSEQYGAKVVAALTQRRRQRSLERGSYRTAVLPSRRFLLP